MIFPPGTLLDPRLQRRDLLRSERLTLPFGRHPLLVVVGSDPFPGERTVRVARCDHVLAFTRGQGRVFQIEAKLSLPRGLIGTVASKAMLSQDRANVFQETDGANLRAAKRAALSSATAPVDRFQPGAKAMPATTSMPASTRR